MFSKDVSSVKGYSNKTLSLYSLLKRCSLHGRTDWNDLPGGSGVYIVYLPDTAPDFQESTGDAIHAEPCSVFELTRKWESINKDCLTDIIYVGKGDDVKKRVRTLIRFGVGKARNHKGGEWLWQIKNIELAYIRIITCPQGKQAAFEKWVLDSFYSEHGNWPLANREGGKGNEVWHPNMDI